MSKRSFILRIVSVIVLIAVIPFVYILVVKPWYSQWGTSEGEKKMKMPGDEIVAKPVWDYTQAITINASAGEIWRWLVQIGQGRGGFYSFELLENMIGCDIHNANQIMSEFQHLAVGDSIKLHPKAPGVPVVLADSAKTIVLGGSDQNQIDAGIWAFLLQELNVNTSRLIARSRIGYSPTIGNIFLQRTFTQPTSLFMQKRMLMGIKQRAEGTFRSSTPESIQVILWLLLYVLFVSIIILILIRRYWIRLFFVGLVTGLMLLLLIAWQPPIGIGVPLVIFNLIGLVWAFRRPVQQ